MLITTYNFYKKYDNVRILVFLRSDIFNGIDFQDKNKIKDNLVEFLDWESKESARLSLNSIAAMRISSNIGVLLNDFEGNWNKVFDSAKISKNQLKFYY